MAANNKFGRWLRKTRQEHKLSQAQLSRLMQVSESIISLLENGHRDPTRRIGRLLAESMGLDAQEVQQRVMIAKFPEEARSLAKSRER